jgi:hypothetical protein
MIQDKHLQTCKEIAEDTSRTPKERDLARILGIAECYWLLASFSGDV